MVTSGSISVNSIGMADVEKRLDEGNRRNFFPSYNLIWKLVNSFSVKRIPINKGKTISNKEWTITRKSCDDLYVSLSHQYRPDVNIFFA